MEDADVAGMPASPSAKVIPPWQTLDDSELGMRKATSQEDFAKEKYDMQAPWQKAGNDRHAEMQKVRAAWDVRQKRYQENCTRERALDSLSKNEILEQIRRTQEYRQQRAASTASTSKMHKDVRNSTYSEMAAQSRRIAAKNRAQEREDCQKARAEAEQALRDKRNLCERRRKENAEERRQSVERGLDAARKKAALVKEQKEAKAAERRRFYEEYEARARVSAEHHRKERVAEQRRAKAIREEHKTRKQVRAAWMVEEKEEQKIRQEFLIRERAEATAQRLALARQEREVREATAEARASFSEDQNARLRSVKSNDKAVWAEERQARRNEANRQLESRHLHAMERKKVADEDYARRNVEPLRRRSEINRARNLQEKAEREAHTIRIQSEVQDIRARKAELRAQDRALSRQPFILG
ncbi:Hypothetical Protein FCC1311_076912 [Hondaea fermentalgiana]|uniref:Trichohyalin-plectin-homology domain-containing protein n=1 Tax=Hondaea fermentalgiana TaxID=2315210 RepID=A0A2R5GKQ8_9STRA|nr:Hypothetical Protein FCC1311_076912 [Hondaea fermentalgiana]|eukprot:GBG31467.1 Hypothetical Protein FCC1311_076912 [Hondaea fermentalgiana]